MWHHIVRRILAATITSACATSHASSPPMCGTATCGTQVAGGVVAGQTWTLAGSPYCVNGTIQVSLLTIQPGVEVYMAPNAEINVLSTVVFEGTAEQPIVFKPCDSAMPWGGIVFDKTPPGSALSYCTITGSNKSALRLSDGYPPTLDHCQFLSNTSTTVGGGIRATGLVEDLVLNDCTVIGNSAASHGGGLSVSMAEGRTLRMIGCLVAGNTANPSYILGNYRGGGLDLLGGNCELLSCDFKDNRVNSRCACGGCSCAAVAMGGGIATAGSGVTMFTATTVANNIADAQHSGTFCGSRHCRGAGVHVASGDCTLLNSQLVCNKSVASGIGCGTEFAGAGLYVSGGSVTMCNCTVALNAPGTGLERAGGTLTVKNAIVYFNNGGAAQIGGAPVDVTYSDVQNGYTGTGNINFTPGFKNGSCPCGDFTLIFGAIPVDKGDPAEIWNDGCRPPGQLGVRNDMGAFGGPGNCAWQCSIVGDLSCDDVVNAVDLGRLLAAWGPCAIVLDCPADLDCNGSVDAADLGILIAAWTG